MEKVLKILKSFSFSFLFVLLGIYVVSVSESSIGIIIGIANIVFFGFLIIWAIYKSYKNSTVKV